MSRPLYERPVDLANEGAVRAEIEQRKRVRFEKLPIVYHADWLVLRDGIPLAVVELKCRTNERRAYPAYMLSLMKWIRGRELAANLGVPFRLIVRWREGVLYQYDAADEKTVRFGFGGRRDRGDPQDQEPVVFIPIEGFVPVFPAPDFD